MLLTSSIGLSATKNGNYPLARMKEYIVDKSSFTEAMLDDTATRLRRSGFISEGKIE